MNKFASHVERHRRELLLHCYRMLGSLPDAEDAVRERLLRAWRYRDSVKKGAPLRHGSTAWLRTWICEIDPFPTYIATFPLAEQPKPS